MQSDYGRFQDLSYMVPDAGLVVTVAGMTPQVTAGSVPSLKPDEVAAMKEFWQAYDANRVEVTARVREAAAAIAEFAPILATMPPEKQEEDDRRARELQKRALLDGDWEPYLLDLKTQGSHYAQLGVSFGSWFKLLTAFRDGLRRHLFEVAHTDVERAFRITKAMNVFIDVAMATLGEAYLATKERIIANQQLAIRELSTPVLQVRDRLLIIPIVGVVDTQRAKLLTQSLLKAIRDRRARAVVMDITGVPIVDSKVANHLVQACEAARLMGARVILSGVSSEIAQALVTLGADLPGIQTVVDLQTGIEEAERLLASSGVFAPEQATGAE